MGTTAVVLGGGYAGVMAANRLAAAARPGLDVVLVSPGERFVERIRLHEYAAGIRSDATASFESVLHPAIRRVRDTAMRIDAAGRSVLLAGGRLLNYDYLVYAVGSSAPQVPDGALTVQQLEGAEDTRTALEALAPGGRVAVVGAGLTAVESAVEIAAHRGDLHVSLHTEGVPLPQVTAAARRGLERSLRRTPVELQSGVRVSGSGDPHLRLKADVVLWCTGFGIPDLASASGLPVDGEGRLLLEPTLRVPGEGRIYGAGDAAVIAGAEYAYLRMSCAAAMPMGADAAGNILRGMDGAPGIRHDSGFGGQCVSLGRSDGLVQFVRADDTPVRVHLHGRLAAVQKEIICRMTLRWIRSEIKRSGAYTWPKGPRITTAEQTQAPAGR
ncbi:NAD(P)/FAD-dependent oxidoreductase [Arthrobacter gengyunqii]|uniref:FAD-dependent oxidoreductase n=1 Tax=Arthrobacter gengyunqii TaxID=2886940 RepID=A0ABS8GLZ1_9MICC|nr:FAD-dependent oxidoreductase [Arthrobacter gengyunqii]MCC3267619.1 FAD-dependent oxidoreductase [Arthrobacter gengyunqii]